MAAANLSLPDAPVDLQAIALDSGSIKLLWTDASGTEDGFEIERRRTGDWKRIATVEANVTEYVDSGLLANTTYEYQVRAYNNAGASGYCEPQSTKTGLSHQTPAAPTNVVAALGDAGDADPNTFDISLSWDWSDPVTAVDAFDVELYADGTAMPGMRVIDIPGEDRAYLDDGSFDDATTYTYRVYARNAYGTSDGTLSDNGILTPVRRPTGLTASPQSDNTLSLTWTEHNTKTATYTVEYQPAGSSVWSQLTTTGAQSTTHSGLGEHSLVSYRVFATSGGQNSPVTTAASGRTLLKTPLSLSATPASNPTSWLSVTWSDVSAYATSWEVRITPEGGATTTETVNQESYTLTGLTENDTVAFQVRALGPSSNVSSWTNVEDGRTRLSPCATVSVSVLSETSLRVTWKAESQEADSIDVGWFTTSGVDSGTATVLPGAMLYTRTGGEPGQTYRFNVLARTSDGNSSVPTDADNTPTTPFNAPASLAAAGQTHNSVTVTFTDNSTAETGFELRESGSHSLFATLGARSGTGSTSRTVTGLPSFDQWQIYARAYYDVPGGPRIYSANTGSVFVYTEDEPPTPTVPAAPSNFAISGGKTGTTISWYDNATNEDNFVLYVLDTSSGSPQWSVLSSTLPANSGTGSTSMGPYTTNQLRQMLPAGTNQYAVAAKNSAGTSARSNSVVFTTP